MIRTLIILIFLVFTVSLKAQPVKVMLVTGGHAYDTVQFFQLFDSLKEIKYKHIFQPEANKKLAEGIGEKFDVLVFYDMWKTISESEKQAYEKLTNQGKPMVFLHHALASYPDWDEFENLLGGRYVLKADGIAEENLSTYKHDVWVKSTVINRHPVTEGLSEFKIFDEVYGNFRVSEKVVSLLKTDHPESTETIAWENRYNSSKIIYLQAGHDYHAYESEAFRKMLLQAIKYLAN